MRVADILPALEAGRRVTDGSQEYRLRDGHLEVLWRGQWVRSYAEADKLLQLEWRVVEEPAKAPDRENAGCGNCWCCTGKRAVVARLTRELEEARGELESHANQEVAWKLQTDRLNGELEETRTSLASEVSRRVDAERALDCVERATREWHECDARRSEAGAPNDRTKG